MNKTQQARFDRLLPNNLPRYVHCYDNGGIGHTYKHRIKLSVYPFSKTVTEEGSIDRYTVVFTGHYAGRKGCDYLSMSGSPFHPQGFGQHGWNQDVIDYPSHGHLGKKIRFDALPEDCQILVLRDYLLTWKLLDTEDNYEKKAREMVSARIKATDAVPV